MKKFSSLKEELESQGNFLCNITGEFLIQARSESEAASKLKSLLDAFKNSTNDQFKSYDVASIEKKELSVTNEKMTPSTAIMNTQKMMSDYLNNKGAVKTDSTYQNLEKMLKVFQSGTVAKMYPTEISVTESVETDLDPNDVDASIKDVESLIKDFEKSEGNKTSQQYQNYKDMLDMLKDIKKNLK